jgi:hypothetical protein
MSETDSEWFEPCPFCDGAHWSDEPCPDPEPLLPPQPSLWWGVVKPDPIDPALRRALRDAQQRAKIRAQQNSLPFDLPDDWVTEQFLRQKGKCAATGLVMNCQHNYPAFVKNPFAPSLDQRVAGRGYTRENTDLVCQAYNIGKGQWDDLVLKTIWGAWLKRQGH